DDPHLFLSDDHYFIRFLGTWQILPACSFIDNWIRRQKDLCHHDESSPFFLLLAAISDVRQDGNEVYLRYEGGEQAKISVLNDSVLRFDMEPDGQFREHPAP